MSDQPTTGQERPARLTAEREWGIRNVGTIGSERALLDELDATRSERDTWKARAERYQTAPTHDQDDLIRAEAESWKRWKSPETWGNTESGAHHTGFLAGYAYARQALAEPQPTAAPTADHPWFTWLPPSASTHRNCCDRPQSEHQPGDIVVRRARWLDGKGAE